jgi:hypothetical protein
VMWCLARQTKIMALKEFAVDLVETLRSETIPSGLRRESEMEQKFLIPAAVRIASQHTDVLMYTHPYGNRMRCVPTCAPAPPAGRGRVVGCWKCWKDNKAWAAVPALGSHHTFDLVAKDNSRSLGLELKVVNARAGRLPSGEIQRFLGQCSLAAVRHYAVIGLVGYRGSVDEDLHFETERVSKWFQERNVTLLLRPIR